MSYVIGDVDMNILYDIKFPSVDRVVDFLESHHQNINELLRLGCDNNEFWIYRLSDAVLVNRYDDDGMMNEYEEEYMTYSTTNEDHPSVIPEIRRTKNIAYKIRRELYVVLGV